MSKDKNQEKKLSRVCYTFADKLTPGRLVRRYKRFLADVTLENGSQVVAHCPNSGSMATCIEENAPVYLSPSNNPKRRTAFTWEMIYINQGWIGVNTIIPNYLAAEAARSQALPLFEGAVAVKPEHKISEHTRLDLLVEKPDGPLYVEVKNVTMMVNGRALFPDAKTTRGAKHLKELMELHKNGARTAMLYIIQRPDTNSFGPAVDKDPEYAELYHQARSQGVEIVAVEARVSPQEVRLHRLITLED
ncbi:DNA/RNA nuclease SfsA [Dethiosulfatarculus sandiegensis]|uniref:Sugar fermentation stimulation protein homolog n=1 Tax=Dethiosulfatarculus sandiegensis TaxID=1429043 RepID=A0A0D2J599_9BACT|nr:DNA/RNA nuclease SfsA [Dethiosulfatarculus sandiegensis]KIX10881.1 XRE family transcriptional regulator [Dethiosulfatarculus sandiegensis]